MSEGTRITKRWIDADGIMRACYGSFLTTGNKAYSEIIALVEAVPAADVIEINAFRNEVYQYIALYKDEDANFLSGLETAVVIAEKMAGVYEEVEE